MAVHFLSVRTPWNQESLNSLGTSHEGVLAGMKLQGLSALFTDSFFDSLFMEFTKVVCDVALAALAVFT